MSLVSLERVAHAFDAAHPLLNGVDFTLNAGERVALLGDNGSGKTTLLHIMVGLIRPLSGEVHAFGRRRQTESDFIEVRAKAGLLFQDADDQLFCPTVAEDVAFGPLNLGKSRAEARAIVHATLDRLGLAHLEERITHKLSGGQKRLVSLAAVLAMEPRVLLLDEPTNALDQPSRERLLEILAELPQAMVLVSHDQDVVERLATRRVTLTEGRLCAAPQAPGAASGGLASAP